MPDSSSVPPPGAASVADTYAPYGQLLKMVLPSCGSVALYDAANELLWTSDAFERLDLRTLLDELGNGAQARDERGCLELKKGGVHAFVAPLRGEQSRPLGALVVELATTQSSRYTVSMVSSLLRPVLDCLVNRMNLERTLLQAEPPDPRPLDLLLSVDEFDRDDATAVQQLLRHSVVQLGASFGALLVPAKSLAITASADARLDGAKALERTRKHLFAWAELNNRPMIVNKIDAAGGAAPFKILACPLRDAEGRVTGLIALFRGAKAPDFELRDVRIFEFVGRKAVGILESQHDPLTGLVNRLIFERRARALIDTASGGNRALLYVDIDRLQAVNDAFGYSAGDEVIRRAAEVLGAMSGGALVTRLGGDRFAVLLPPVALAAAEQRARAIAAALADVGYTNGETTVAVTASVGATLVAPGIPVGHALATVELACKRAKELGRNRVEWSAPDVEAMSLSRTRRVLAARSIEDAIRANQFRLDAQPLVGLRTRHGETIGYELLVRMQSPTGEDLAPDKFFDAAERYELMPALDRWVLTSAIEALKQKSGALDSRYALMVNVSAQSVATGKFPEFALQQIAEAGLPAAAFCFEIVEAAAVGQLAAAEQFIRALAAGGCKVALDDFGCGLSSLAHLKQLPVHYLKIDGRFVRRVCDDRIAESIVSGLAKAGRTLGVGVIAEHVESEAVALRLAELDVDWGQGFHFGRPQPLVEVAAAFANASAARERRTAGS